MIKDLPHSNYLETVAVKRNIPLLNKVVSEKKKVTNQLTLQDF